LQDGRIIDTRSGNHREIKFSSLKVFATCNELSKLIEPLRDRFDRYDLPQYTFEDFNSICSKVVKVKDCDLKQKIISAVWDELGSRNVRDVINSSRYINTYDDLEKYIKIKKKYCCNPFYITVIWKHNDTMLIEISYMVTQSSEMN
jgi:Holliday junction resolvasome RuvABC ATP-dependent DNA helicase subunit